MKAATDNEVRDLQRHGTLLLAPGATLEPWSANRWIFSNAWSRAPPRCRGASAIVGDVRKIAMNSVCIRRREMVIGPRCESTTGKNQRDPADVYRWDYDLGGATTTPENAQAKVNQKEIKHTLSTTPVVRWSILLVQALSEGAKSMPKLDVSPLLPSRMPTMPARRRVSRATISVSLPIPGGCQDAHLPTLTVRRFVDELVRSGIVNKAPVKGLYRWQDGNGNPPQRLVVTVTLAGYKHLLELLTGDNSISVL